LPRSSLFQLSSSFFFLQEIQAFAGSFLGLPSEINDLIVSFALRSGDLVSRVADIISFQAKGYLKLLVAIIRRDQVAIREALLSKSFFEDCVSLKIKRPAKFIGFLALTLCANPSVVDLLKADNLSLFSTSKAKAVPCLNLFNLHQELYSVGFLLGFSSQIFSPFFSLYFLSFLSHLVCYVLFSFFSRARAISALFVAP
jgi:hypothetical protein